MVLVADDADGVAGLASSRAAFCDWSTQVQVASMTSRSPLPFTCSNSERGHAVRADDERAALDLVGQVGGADAAVGQVGLDARVVDELPEGGDLLALVARVLGLVDREAHAVAEAGALGDADVRSGRVAVVIGVHSRRPRRIYGI